MVLAQPGSGHGQRWSDRMWRAAQGPMTGARDAWLIRAVKGAENGAQISSKRGLWREEENHGTAEILLTKEQGWTDEEASPCCSGHLQEGPWLAVSPQVSRARLWVDLVKVQWGKMASTQEEAGFEGGWMDGWVFGRMGQNHFTQSRLKQLLTRLPTQQTLGSGDSCLCWWPPSVFLTTSASSK